MLYLNGLFFHPPLAINILNHCTVPSCVRHLRLEWALLLLLFLHAPDLPILSAQLGCTHETSGKGCSPAHDCPWTLVPESKNWVHRCRADCIEASWWWLHGFRMERNHRILYRRWALCYEDPAHGVMGLSNVCPFISLGLLWGLLSCTSPVEKKHLQDVWLNSFLFATDNCFTDLPLIEWFFFTMHTSFQAILLLAIPFCVKAPTLSFRGPTPIAGLL